jgi:glycosyltransferase involved in cell wall biosynthesis
VAGRGAQTDAQVEFSPLPLADSLHPDILGVKLELDRGRVPDGFAPLVDALTGELEALCARADWVIGHNVGSLNKNLALTAALNRICTAAGGPRLVLWHHDLAWTTPRYRDELHDGWPWDLLRAAWPGAVQVTVSEYRRRELADLMGLAESAIHVVPNGLDAARFLKFEPQTSAFVDRLGLLEGWPVMLLPVRITPRKNLELGLRVLAAIRQSHPRAMLVVTGPLGAHNASNQQYFSALLALRKQLQLEQSAHFLAEHTSDFLPDEVISDFYKISDVLFMPSREEGFGIPILEAGLSAMAVFCADIPVLRELGRDHARYFALDDEPAHIAGMIREHLRTSDILALRERVRSGYIWYQIHRKHLLPLLNSNGG